MNIDLEGLSFEPSRHGKPRWYVRKNGRRMRIEGVDCAPPYPTTRAALAAYHAARAGLEAGRKRNGAGTFRWLVEEYMRSKTWRRLDTLTQSNRRSVLMRLVDGAEATKRSPVLKSHGDKPYALLTPAGIVKLRDELDGDPANARVKCLRYLFAWAIENEHAADNPASSVSLIRIASRGYIPWSRADMLKFEERHPLGTKAHLALAMHLYTGQRRSDVVQWGHQNRQPGNRLVYMQHKGRNQNPKQRDIPIVAPFRAVLDASPLGKVTWLETEHGQPFSIAGYGNWFRDRCVEAGVTARSHGIRKLVGIMAAERGATAHQIMQILGHDTLDEAERYTREANAVKVGDAGFNRIWGTEHG